MRILAIDTALEACAACVLDEAHESLLSAEAIPMERGHAEALVPLIDRVVGTVEGGFPSLDRVAVTIGPGSFTGLRVGIAAARAIGLAAGIPVVGVTTLSALLAVLMAADTRRLMAAAINARHGAVFFQAVAPGGRHGGRPGSPDGPRSGARHRRGAGGADRLRRAARRRRGPGARARRGRGGHAGCARHRLVARLGLSADPAGALPKPLYLRAPDAKPQDAARLPRR